MIRQAQTYLAGAGASAALLAAAVVGFIAVAWFSTQSVFPDPDIGAGADLSAPFAPSLERTVLSRASGSGAPGTGGAASAGATAGRGGATGDQPAGESPQTDLGGGPGPGPGPSDPGDPGSSSTRGPAPSASAGGGAIPTAGAGSTVNQTIDEVDETLGGTLSQTGAGEIAKGAVSTVTGPDSPVTPPLEAAGGVIKGATGR